jgi:Protein of unknown function (DUF3072)
MSSSREDRAPSDRDSTTPQASGIADPSDERANGTGMTQKQRAMLHRLSQEALEPEAFSGGLSKAEAQRRIEALAAKLRLQDGPPHTR